MGNGPCESLLPKRQAVCVHNEEIDPSKCEISKEDMAQENVSHLIIDNNDDIINVETLYLIIMFYFTNSKYLVSY